MKIKFVGAVVVLLAFALPPAGKTYESTYPVSCSELCPAVKSVLADAEHYELKANDDAKMHADYEAKHAAPVTVTGVFRQRTNHVTLVPKGTGCELQVVSNFSGGEHDEKGDFKRRVDDAPVTLKAPKPAEPAKPVGPAKPAEATRASEPAKPANPPRQFGSEKRTRRPRHATQVRRNWARGGATFPPGERINPQEVPSCAPFCECYWSACLCRLQPHWLRRSPPRLLRRIRSALGIRWPTEG